MATFIPRARYSPTSVANSPWSSAYEALWHLPVSLAAGDASVSLTLQHWVDDGLMTVFFFVIGLVPMLVMGLVGVWLGILLLRHGFRPRVTPWALILFIPGFFAITEVTSMGSVILPSLWAWAYALHVSVRTGAVEERVHAPKGKQLKETPNDPQKDQFALEMDHMAECVRQNKTPYTPGEEGLQDQRIMEAIYQSAKENKPVKLPAVAKIDAFRGTPPQEEEA